MKSVHSERYARFLSAMMDARVQLGLSQRELAAVRVRFGYRRLHVLWRREGWKVNHKKIYRLYCQEGLEMRTKKRRKLASRARVPLQEAEAPNERWSMDFMTDRLVDGRAFRVLTVGAQLSRECPLLMAGFP